MMSGFTELALVLLVYAVVFLTAFFLLYLAVKRGVANGMRDASGAETNRGGGARRILDERYARGEISQEEYEQMRRDVEGRQRPDSHSRTPGTRSSKDHQVVIKTSFTLQGWGEGR